MQHLKRQSWARTFIAGAIALGVVSSGGVALSSAPTAALAAPTAAEWEQTAFTSRVIRLFAPSSGALLAWGTSPAARNESALYQSNDGGVTWSEKTLPPGAATIYPPAARMVEVDPSDHDVLYAAGTDGLYRSIDGSATWELIRASAYPIKRLAISPADPNLLYAHVDSGTLSRSRDRGTTWDDEIEAPGELPAGRDAPMCPTDRLLLPHPTDPMRIIGLYRCSLAESRDQGATWKVLLDERSELIRGEDFSEVVGGNPSMPGRFYAVTTKGGNSPGHNINTLLRSDDEGATWQALLSGEREGRVAGLVLDPGDPNRLFLGFGAPRLYSPAVSVDGGATWSTLGKYVSVPSSSLVLGVDQKNLYIGSLDGVSRISLD